MGTIHCMKRSTPLRSSPLPRSARRSGGGRNALIVGPR